MNVTGRQAEVHTGWESIPRQSAGCFVSLIGNRHTGGDPYTALQLANKGGADPSITSGGFFSFIGEFAPTVGQLPTICISARPSRWQSWPTDPAHAIHLVPLYRFLRRCACPRNADAFQRCSYLLGGHLLRLALRARLASGLDRWRNQPIMLKPSMFRPTSNFTCFTYRLPTIVPTSAVPSSRVHGQCMPIHPS